MGKLDIYNKTKKRAKAFNALAPVTFWVFLALSVVCLVFAVRNSFGNIIEIIHKLDKKGLTGDELKANYDLLVAKYGEWVIGQGTGGFTITFINIGNAFFSAFAIVNFVLAVFFFLSAYICGKWLFPLISRNLTQDNQDMVNAVILTEHDNKNKKE